MNRTIVPAAAFAVCVLVFPGEVRSDEAKEAQAVEVKAPVLLRGALVRQAPVDAREEQIKQMTAHYTQSFRPILSSELAFIRLVCDIPEEQRPKIKAAGEASLQKAARQLAEQQIGPRVRLPFVNASERPDARTAIRDALVAALKETLPADTVAEYTREAEKRTARRKRAAIANVVAQLDATLWLTAEQREKIFDAIAANWQERWEQWLLLQNYGGQYFPQIPDEQIVGHLNAEQKSIWSGVQKVDFESWGGGDGLPPENDGWWGDDPDQPMEAAGVIEGFIIIDN